MPNGEPKIAAHPIVDKDGKPLDDSDSQRRYKTLRNVIALLNFKAEGDELEAKAKKKNKPEEAKRLIELAKKLKEASNNLEKLLKKGGIFLVDDIPKESPANTSTNPKNPKEKRVLIRTQMVDLAKHICHPLFLYLLEVLFHEGIHLGQQQGQRPKEPEGLDEEGKKKWRRQHLLPYKLEVASAEYEAYFWNDLFLDQIPKVLEKIKGNMEKPPPKPAVLDGLTEGEKKWARLWEHCHPDMVNVAQKLVQDHLKNKKAALADLGSITPGGKPPPESEYDQLENKLGADKGKLEKLLDNGYHFTWFAETDPVRDIEDVSEIFMIGFSSTSRYSSDGVDMGMGSPQTIKYIHSDNYSPFVIICGTTEINGKGDPKMLVRPVNPQAYNVESGIWEISSLNQFLSEVQIDMILPEALIRPTSVIVEDTGRVLIWDSEGIGLYALNEIDEAGLPHAIQSDSLLQLSQQDQEALRGRPILCQYGEQLAAFTRPITKDRGSSPVTFLFRNQDAGLYDHISTYEPTDLPWIRPLIPQPVFSGESWISVSGSGGHEVEVKILSGQETVHSILQTILDSGREPTLLSMPDSLIGGQFVQVVDLVNQSESVKEPVVERLVHALTIPGRKKLVEDASWHHVISVIDIREFKIYIRDGYRDRVKSALDASDDWVIEDLAWDTPFDVSDIDQFDKAQSEQPWHILVIKDHYTLSVPGNTRIKIEHSDSSIDYCRLLEEYEVCLPFTGIDSVAKFGDIKCLEYPEASWKGSPEVSVQHIPVSIRDLGLLEKDYSALVPGERPIKKRKLVIFGILMGIILAILILLSLELSGFFCSGPCAITNCTPAHPCTWKGKTYTSGKICGFGEGVICDPGILYDCRCNTFIETLPNGTKQPTCLCH